MNNGTPIEIFCDLFRGNSKVDCPKHGNNSLAMLIGNDVICCECLRESALKSYENQVKSMEIMANCFHVDSLYHKDKIS